MVFVQLPSTPAVQLGFDRAFNALSTIFNCQLRFLSENKYSKDNKKTLVLWLIEYHKALFDLYLQLNLAVKNSGRTVCMDDLAPLLEHEILVYYASRNIAEQQSIDKLIRHFDSISLFITDALVTCHKRLCEKLKIPEKTPAQYGVTDVIAKKILESHTKNNVQCDFNVSFCETFLYSGFNVFSSITFLQYFTAAENYLEYNHSFEAQRQFLISTLKWIFTAHHPKQQFAEGAFEARIEFCLASILEQSHTEPNRSWLKSNIHTVFPLLLRALDILCSQSDCFTAEQKQDCQLLMMMSPFCADQEICSMLKAFREMLFSVQSILLQSFVISEPDRSVVFSRPRSHSGLCLATRMPKTRTGSLSASL